MPEAASPNGTTVISYHHAMFAIRPSSAFDTSSRLNQAQGLSANDPGPLQLSKKQMNAGIRSFCIHDAKKGYKGALRIFDDIGRLPKLCRNRVERLRMNIHLREERHSWPLAHVSESVGNLADKHGQTRVYTTLQMNWCLINKR
jgi:hypothetical protein